VAEPFVLCHVCLFTTVGSGGVRWCLAQGHLHTELGVEQVGLGGVLLRDTSTLS